MTVRSIRTPLAAAAALLLGLQNTEAQYLWDVGAHLGAANYLGEMGGKEQTRRDFVWDMKLGQTRWTVGGFARRKMSRLISLNAGLLYLRVQGADANSTNPARVARNLNFRNDMFELYVRPEVTIYQDNDLGGRGRYRSDFRLFAYAGLAAFYSSPKGQLNGDGAYHNLRALNTELADYGAFNLAIPAGIGFHITKKRRHRFGWDFGWRTTFTDYIDDVSTVYADPARLPSDLSVNMANQTSYAVALDPSLPHPNNYTTGDKRGDPTHNDSYLTMTLTYSYVLRGQSNFYRQRYSWIRGAKKVGRKSRAKF